MFYYEILSKPDRAMQLSKNAYDEAVAELEQLQVGLVFCVLCFRLCGNGSPCQRFMINLLLKTMLMDFSIFQDEDCTLIMQLLRDNLAVWTEG